MKIVTLGSSSTNFKHWGVPQNSVFGDGWWFCLKHKPFFVVKVTKTKASMELCKIYETTPYIDRDIDIRPQ